MEVASPKRKRLLRGGSRYDRKSSISNMSFRAGLISPPFEGGKMGIRTQKSFIVVLGLNAHFFSPEKSIYFFRDDDESVFGHLGIHRRPPLLDSKGTKASVN